MTSSIHPTAVVDSKAQIADDVEIGPYCIVGPGVALDRGVKLMSHVVIGGQTHIGEETVVFPFASLGQKPQDLKYKGEPSRLEIGKKNQIREYVTMSPGTEGGGMVTRVGDGGLFMISVHIAHDCQVGNGVVFANATTLAGHVTVGDYAVLGGLSAVHQFVRIGAYAMIGGMSGVESDVIPYGTVKGDRAHLAGLNLIGLERRGFAREDIHALRSAYRMLFASEGTMVERVDDVVNMYKGNPLIGAIVEFIRNRSSRPLCQPRGGE